MTVSITNTSGRCQAFVLTHEHYCQALGDCVCDRSGGREARLIPRSITLAAGVTIPAVADALMQVPEVIRAIKRGELVVTRNAPTPKPNSPKPKRGG